MSYVLTVVRADGKRSTHEFKTSRFAFNYINYRRMIDPISGVSEPPICFLKRVKAADDRHEIWVISGDDSTGYYTEGHSMKLKQQDPSPWFCFDTETIPEMVQILHDDLGFSTEEIDKALQVADLDFGNQENSIDHDLCLVNFGIATLREGCDWVGHWEAYSEHGYCPVCQHPHPVED